MGKSRPFRRAVAVVLTLAAAVALALLPASAVADPPAVATTEPATNVTSTSAVLNGLANPSGGAATYHFQYWTATNPAGTNTTPTPVTSESVSASISGLLPGTTYSFRLIVVETYQETNTTHTGDTLSFTTPATPGTVATTGQATGITATSAQLNGVTNTTDSTATWYFQWGRTAAYGEMTSPQTVSGGGLNFVSAMITGLTPRTRYHFRLVVLQSDVMPNHGTDSSFITAHPSGRASLLSHRLKVRHGSAGIPFKCKGQRGDPCQAKVSLQAHRLVGKHSVAVSCGKAMLKTSAPRRSTIHVKLGSRCDGLLKSSKNHRISAKLRAIFSTHQRRLRATVTLISV